MRYRLCCEGNSEEATYRQKRTHSSTLADLSLVTSYKPVSG